MAGIAASTQAGGSTLKVLFGDHLGSCHWLCNSGATCGAWPTLCWEGPGPQLSWAHSEVAAALALCSPEDAAGRPTPWHRLRCEFNLRPWIQECPASE